VDGVWLCSAPKKKLGTLPCHVEGRLRPCKALEGVGSNWKFVFVSLRGVVQLVRTPACHARSRGFESRRSRQIFAISLETIEGLIVRSFASSRGPSLAATFMPVLRLTSGRTYTSLRRMKPFGKVGVSLMSLLLLATPIMACLVPAAAMTAAERDCCKRMAHECGNKGMPQSHSCCQTTTVPDHLAAIKSSSEVNSLHPTLFVAYAIHPAPAIATMLESGSSPWAADIHSPPVSPPVAVSVLRI
jgi:hypothetical protein